MIMYRSSIGEILKRLDVLEEEVASLRAENGQLRAENAQLQAQNAQLQAENVRLREENSELRRRLGQNSDNSHKPPSSDGYRKKRVQPGLPREGKRPKGGQPGHQGRTLRQVDSPDRIEVHLPSNCRVCGRSFGVDEPHGVVSRRQVFDLPEPKLEVTEHRLAEITCCGAAQRGSYPAGVDSAVQYGPGVQALAVKLSVDHKMPLEQISALFSDLYGYDLNSETVERGLAEGYELAAPVEAEVRSQLQQAAVVHFDETGVRAAGKLHWLHTASTGQYTLLFVHEKRGAEALRCAASILPEFRGWAIHDYLGAYFQFSQTNHGACHAHTLRELTGLVENGSVWAGEMRAFLLDLYGQALPLQGEAAEAARRRYRQLLSQAEQEEPPPTRSPRPGRPKSTPGRNLLRRLTEQQDAVLAFALVAGVPFTNNQAERDLRPAKVKLKVSGGFRTQQGARVYARLQALIATCRKQQRNVFLTLRQLFAHQPVSLLAGG